MAQVSQNGQAVKTAANGEALVSPQSVLSANWLEDQRQLLRLRRFKTAADWGVPSSLLEPTMAPTNITQNSDGGGFWKGALLGAAILAGGAGAGYLLTKQPAPAKPVPADSDSDTVLRLKIS